MIDDAQDPYRSPAVASVDRTEPQRSERRGLSPEWAILLGQTPLYAIFASFVLLTAFSPGWPIGEALVRLVSLELTLFNSRVLFCGPGDLRTRMPLALACAFASTFLFGWIKLAQPTGTTDNWIGIVVSTELRFVLAASLGPAIAAALGSRDRLRDGMKRPERSFAPLAIAASLASATALFNVVAGLRLDPSVVVGFLFQASVVALIGFGVVQIWRIGIRGIPRLLSWQTCIFAVGVFLTGCGFVTLLRASISNPNMDVVIALQVLFAFGAVPTARELFLRAAGYRAVNLYDERRRSTREASAVESLDSSEVR